ncbi:hypothetical protein BMR1_02g02235 [Babesia microti strain RI]|uniref:Uncharacterized protein n=1 Tax=Babesia microti (strain RI) TaxID=1133968 RepID=I7IQ96_BABMR|nr:hypothetical protein BMR1_02g02235 [Babesia microti strain RI]CCF73605.1 hypothetical protein BMR1_02g02235 [Babesia microti strain RI]|eukprot:XP_012648214.1 hypothetical protein BMR1_02g02235 [Babesia microti strain RI]
MGKYNLPKIDGFQVCYFDPEVATGSAYIVDDDERQYRNEVMAKFAEFVEIRKKIDEKHRAKLAMEDKIRDQLRYLKSIQTECDDALFKQIISDYMRLKVLLEKTILLRTELQLQYACLCDTVERRIDYLIDLYRLNRDILNKIKG